MRKYVGRIQEKKLNFKEAKKKNRKNCRKK